MRTKRSNVYPVAGEETIIKEKLPVVIEYSNDNIGSLEYIEVTRHNEEIYQQYSDIIQLAKKRGKRLWLVFVNKEKK